MICIFSGELFIPYECDDDLLKIIEYTHSDYFLKGFTSVTLLIKTSSINDDFCDTIRNILKLLPDPQKVSITFRRIIDEKKMLSIFTESNNLKLGIDIGKYFYQLDAIKLFLSQVDAQMLNLCASIKQINELSETINTNNHIISVQVKIVGLDKKLDVPTNPISKINIVTINKFSDPCEKSIIDILSTAPAFTKLSLLGSYAQHNQYRNKLEIILNYISLNSNFKKLLIQSYMYDEDIEYICERIVDTNIQCIRFIHNIESARVVDRICYLIKNNKTIDSMYLISVNSAAFYEIIGVLSTNTSITNFSIRVSMEVTENESIQLQKFIDDTLIENYTLLKLSIFTNYSYNIITSNVTIRNSELSKQKRFINTKPIIHII